jgi:3-hydroxymyristoyl/3-hydroxydecanoyl-(acyl carrier protein) dehydratase
MFELMQSVSIDVASGRARGTAFIPAEHPMLADHVPGAPILPGSFIIELAAQVCGPLAEETIRTRLGLERWAMLGMIRDAKFLRPTPLPATLVIEAETRRAESSNVVVHVTARAGEHQVLRAELWMAMFEAQDGWAEAIAARRARLARWKGEA